MAKQICSRVNRGLLPVKFFYFFVVSASGTVFPFVSIYMRHLSLSASESGIITGLMPFVAFFTQMIIGPLADNFNKQKQANMLFCFLTGASLLSMLYIPHDETARSSDQLAGDIVCLIDPAGSDHSNNQSNRNCSMTIFHDLGTITAENDPGNSDNILCLLMPAIPDCDVNSTDNPLVDLRDNIIYRSEIAGKLCIRESARDMLTRRMSSNVTVCDKVSRIRLFQAETGDYNYTTKNISLVSSADSRLDCSQYLNVCNYIDLHTASNNSLNTSPESTLFGQTFWITFILYLIASVSIHATMTFGDSLAYATLGDQRNRWGRQRFFGALAIAIFSLPISVAMDIFNSDLNYVQFDIVFYTSACLLLVTVGIIWFLKKPEAIENRFGTRETLKKLVKTVFRLEVTLMLIGLATGGSTIGLVASFRFWFLRDLGSSALILGMCLLISTLSDMVFYQVVPLMLKNFSEIHCVCIALLMDAVRVLCYSFITNPWYILIPATLQGFTTSVIWAAGSCYASRIAPCGMIASVQSLFAGFLFGLGRGLGSLLTGLLYDRIGSLWTFRAYAASITFCLLCLFTADVLHKKLVRERNENTQL